ncbi:hypothetical protein BGY98DRAFT_934986 [Russula aff. rugulosa BPL654]|nr:hypothetical protein BGY98DRAFT_934986 [Russula aff. rugulosa BPL654]
MPWTSDQSDEFIGRSPADLRASRWRPQRSWESAHPNSGILAIRAIRVLSAIGLEFDGVLWVVVIGLAFVSNARSFDGFGPISPALPHTSLITNEGSAKDGRGRFSSSEESSSEGELSPNDEMQGAAHESQHSPGDADEDQQLQPDDWQLQPGRLGAADEDQRSQPGSSQAGAAIECLQSQQDLPGVANESQQSGAGPPSTANEMRSRSQLHRAQSIVASGPHRPRGVLARKCKGLGTTGAEQIKRQKVDCQVDGAGFNTRQSNWDWCPQQRLLKREMNAPDSATRMAAQT